MLSEISDQEKTIIVNNSQRSSVYESLKRRSTYSSLTTFGKKIKSNYRLFQRTQQLKPLLLSFCKVHFTTLPMSQQQDLPIRIPR